MTEEQTHGNNELETTETTDATIKKHRSPNYPYIGLEAALERASELQKVAGVHPVRVTTAWETWDYKKGAGNQIVAALDAYGLISVESGIADNRQIKLTLEARKILDNTSERVALLKEAALSPLLHKEIWEYFDGDLPPNDKVIREYLVYQRNFNPSYVDKFIEQFRDTLLFANVAKSDKIGISNDIEINNTQRANTQDNNNKGGNEMDNAGRINQALNLPEGVVFRASLEVLTNGKINVLFAGSMTRKSVAILQDIYDMADKHDPQDIDSPKQISVVEPPLLKSGEEDTDSD